MKKPDRFPLGIEGGALVLLLIVFAASGAIVGKSISAGSRRLASRQWMRPARELPPKISDFQSLEVALETVSRQPVHLTDQPRALFVSELRVVAIGSAYPISYEAEVCPFSDIPQPAMNQLDFDGDGITDDWEIKYGMDKFKAADALYDPDDDGFSNLEEFRADTDPSDPESHPPYVVKFRFVERKDVPFPFVFNGSSKISDGRTVFQLNSIIDGKTYFRSLGENVEGVVLQRFVPAFEGDKDRLIVMRGSVEVELFRGEKTADPESQAELINMLDRRRIIATMGALLSLCNDEYTVLGVCPDKVVVRHHGTGEVFDIVGLSEEEQDGFSADL